MLFAFLAFAASLLLGLVSGVPLTDYHSDGLGFTAVSNSTYLAARFVHSSTPAACTSTNVFCLTVQIAKHAFVHVSIYGRKPVWVVNHDWVNHTPIWRTYGEYASGRRRSMALTAAFRDHSLERCVSLQGVVGAMLTHALAEAVAGDITYQCNGRPNPEDGARIAFGFAINGGTHVSL